MAHIHRTGLTDPLFVDVPLTASKPARTIHNGDLLAKDVNASPAGAVPSASFTWDTDKATTQAEFAAAFLGLAAGESASASTDARQLTIPVLQDGNVEFDCAAATYTEGQFLGPGKGAGNNLINTVEVVATKSLAIAVVQKNTAASATRVVGRLLNTMVKR